MGYLRDDIIVGLVGSTVAFGINHGDVVADDLSLYPRYLGPAGTTGMPWHHAPGNHESTRTPTEDRIRAKRGSASLVRATTPSSTPGDLHPARQRSLRWPAGVSRNGKLFGGFGERQLQFVSNLLKHIRRDHLIVVSMHIPLVSHHDDANPADNTPDRRALLELLSGRPHTVRLAGHMHTTEHHYLGAEKDLPGRPRIITTS